MLVPGPAQDCAIVNGAVECWNAGEFVFATVTTVPGL